MINKSQLSKISTGPQRSIGDIIKILDSTGYGIVIIVDESNILLGTITDGDLRRAILKRVSFDLPCGKICNYSPVYAKQGASREEIKYLFDNNVKMFSLDQIPLLDDVGRVVGLELRKDYMIEAKKDNIVVIMAGGLGSRLSPLTLNCPKPLLNIAGKPVLEILLARLIEEGFINFLISVNYKANMIQEKIGNGQNWGVNIDYVFENQKLGTAGPLSLMLDQLTESFFVINSDILTKVNFSKMLEFHHHLHSDATVCIREHEHIVPYGVVELSDHRLVHIQEKPVYNCFVSTGIYVLSPSVLEYLPSNVYFDMNQLLSCLLGHSKAVNSYPIHEYWIDIGKMEDLERAHQEYQAMF